MKYGDDLVKKLAELALTDRAKVLKLAIETTPEVLEEYQEILALQKRLVAAEATGDTGRALVIRTAYDHRLASLRGSAVVSEYLDILAELNDVAQETAEILNQGLRSE
ncbi:MAG: hypothetical protein V1761_03965 [bacterium]